MITQRQLSAFLAVAHHRSFIRAADQLNLTPAAVSLTIKQLETDSQAKLFERTTRSVELSGEGQSFLPYAQAMWQSSLEANRALTQLGQGEAGALVLGVAPSVAKRLMPDILSRFIPDSPGVEVQILEGTAEQVFGWVAEGRVELGLQGDIEGFPALWRSHALDDPFVRIGSGPRIGLTPDTAIERALAATGWPAPAVRASAPDTALQIQARLGGSLILPQLTVGGGGHPRMRGLTRRLVWIGQYNRVVSAAARRFFTYCDRLEVPQDSGGT